jgi:hypothetical protein
MKRVLGFLIVGLSALAVSGAVTAEPSGAGAGAAPKIVEIHQGEILPLRFVMSGDFVETEPASTVELRAKEDLWLRISASQVEMSFDGRDYRPVSELVTGSVTLGIQDPSAALTVGLTLEAK